MISRQASFMAAAPSQTLTASMSTSTIVVDSRYSRAISRFS